MDYPQNLSKSDRRWFDLIQQCRTSGKSDRQWLIDNNIKSGSFYYHIKRLDGKGRFQWPRNASEVRPLTRQEFRWLMEGLSIEQPKAFQPSE